MSQEDKFDHRACMDTWEELAKGNITYGYFKQMIKSYEGKKDESNI